MRWLFVIIQRYLLLRCSSLLSIIVHFHENNISSISSYYHHQLSIIYNNYHPPPPPSPLSPQLLGAVTEQVMRRAALGPPSRHASVALQLERGMGAAFQAYAVAIERLCLDALDPKRAPAVIERSVGGAGGGEGGNAAWTTKRLATMVSACV